MPNSLIRRSAKCVFPVIGGQVSKRVQQAVQDVISTTVICMPAKNDTLKNSMLELPVPVKRFRYRTGTGCHGRKMRAPINVKSYVNNPSF